MMMQLKNNFMITEKESDSYYSITWDDFIKLRDETELITNDEVNPRIVSFIDFKHSCIIDKWGGLITYFDCLSEEEFLRKMNDDAA